MHFFFCFLFFRFFCGSGWRRRRRRWRRRRGLCEASCQQLHTTASSFLQTTGCVSGFRESEGFSDGSHVCRFLAYGRQRWRWRWRRRASAQPRRHLSGQSDGGGDASCSYTRANSGKQRQRFLGFFFSFLSANGKPLRQTALQTEPGAL